jgi:hypothetical protein
MENYKKNYFGKNLGDEEYETVSQTVKRYDRISVNCGSREKKLATVL